MRVTASLLSLFLVVGVVAAQQPNAPTSSMVVNLSGTTTSVGPLFVNVPALATNPTNLSVVITGGAGLPFILANANAGLGGTILPIGFPAPPLGLVDIGPIGFPPIEFILDGFANAGTLLGALATIGTAGTTTINFNGLGAGFTCGTTLANLQAVIPTPSLPAGLQLSAATQIRTALPAAPDSAPVPISVCDDCTTQANFSGCQTFTFYGTAYQNYFVNSNGSVSFVAGDTSLGETQTAFNSGRPKIAAAWDDLRPGNNASTLTKFDSGLTVVVQWTNVPEFSTTGSNTLSITMDIINGTITMAYGAMSLTDCLTGITPGGGLAAPATVFGPAAPTRLINHLASAGGIPYLGGALESMNELFVTVATPTAAPFNLATQTAVFTPVLNAYILN